MTLSFPDARRAESVATADGEEVWRWSRGRTFAQVLGEETLAPGERRTFEATSERPDPGEYRVEGGLPASNADARAEATVPGVTD